MGAIVVASEEVRAFCASEVQEATHFYLTGVSSADRPLPLEGTSCCGLSYSLSETYIQ